MLKTRHADIILLLADGFDEATVGVLLTSLRQCGLAVKVVALRAKRVSGAHGLIIVPDNSLDRILEGSEPMLALILPQGNGLMARLLVDPRVNQLLQQSINSGAFLVAFGPQAKQLMTDLAEIEGKSVTIIQPETGAYLEDFASKLAQLFMASVEV